MMWLMPRVSAEHLAARRQQILDAARRCFVRDGFHATSMQQVIAEAGLSVGAVYRYFPAKSDLIVGVAEHLATGIATQLAVLVGRDDLTLVEIMEAAAGVVDANAGPDGALRIAVQVWSEAQRDPVLAALGARMYGEVVKLYEQIASDAIKRGELPEDADPAQVGAALTALVVGYGLLRLLLGAPDLTSYRAGLRTLLTFP
jgi:AcrR family transcriptional regulator